MEQFIVLRKCSGNVTEFPFMAFVVETTAELDKLVGKEIITGDLVYAIDHKLIATNRPSVYLAECK